MKVRVLGCGTSSGVPYAGIDETVWNRRDPRNWRRRCALYLEWRGLRLLIDTGADLRMQLIDAGISRLDGLIYTHAHADHVHGVDDLRAVNNVIGKAIPTFGHASVLEKIDERFGYVFLPQLPDRGFFRPALIRNDVEEGVFDLLGERVTTFRQVHGRGESWGFRFDDFAYSTDVSDLDDKAFAALEGVKVWIVGALCERVHPAHAHLAKTLQWIERLGPKRAYLTHMNGQVDYEDWAMKTPANVLPAHDGLEITLPLS